MCSRADVAARRLLSCLLRNMRCCTTFAGSLRALKMIQTHKVMQKLMHPVRGLLETIYLVEFIHPVSGDGAKYGPKGVLLR